LFDSKEKYIVLQIFSQIWVEPQTVYSF
jgi:hypothetical protein